jgi:hypothetical protein
MVLDDAGRQEGGSASVQGMKERYLTRFLKGMVTSCANYSCLHL